MTRHQAESASTSQKGHVQLSTSTTRTSTSLAATASAVKTVTDALTSHKAAAAPHSGHETPAGAQAKADAAESAAKSYADGVAAGEAGAVRAELEAHLSEIATQENLGHVKVDGETILVDVNGKISTPVKTRLYKGRLQYWDTVSELWRDAGMIASEPHVADFYQQAATYNTWYTVVNVSGAGVVYRISGCAKPEQNNVLQYQVVIDGVKHIFDMQAGSPQNTRGFGGDPDLVKGREYFSDILLHVKFDESLKVNIRHDSGTNVTLQCSVDFGLV